MLPDAHFALATAGRTLRERHRRTSKPRSGSLAPPEWPPSRGPTPNPARH